MYRSVLIVAEVGYWNTLCAHDEFADLLGILSARASFDTTADVDPVRPDEPNSILDVIRIEATRQNNSPVLFGFDRNVPIKCLPGPSIRSFFVGIQKERIDDIIPHDIDIKILVDSEDFDDARLEIHQVVGTIVSEQLNSTQIDMVNDVSNEFPLSVDENAYCRDMLGEAFDNLCSAEMRDEAGTLFVKDEANRVGTATHRELGVFHVRNPTDFHKQILFHFTPE